MAVVLPFTPFGFPSDPEVKPIRLVSLKIPELSRIYIPVYLMSACHRVQ